MEGVSRRGGSRKVVKPTMGIKYLIEKHVGKGMEYMFQDRILKLNHLLFDKLFKWIKTRAN
jgi:hypothetical protein